MPRKTTESKQNVHLTLEVLLSSPFCWKSDKICTFFHEAHNCIKVPDTAIKAFCTDMNNAAISSKTSAWPGKKKWKDGMDIDHIRILETSYDQGMADPKKRRNLQNTMTQLLGVLRNKQEHCNDIATDDKAIIPWYKRSGTNQFVFSKRLFSKYWTSMFPCLSLFLWWKFQLFKNLNWENLEKFYNCPPGINPEDYNALKDFSKQFHVALKTQMNQGDLVCRFKSSDYNGLTVECRVISEKTLQNLLDGSSCCVLNILSSNVQVRWYNFGDDGKPVFCTEERETALIPSSNAQTCSIFVGKKAIEILNKNKSDPMQLKILNFFCSMIDPTKTGNELVLFVGSIFNSFDNINVLERVIEKIVKSTKYNFTSCPLSITEVCPEVAQRIKKFGKVTVQNRDVLVTSFLSDSNIIGSILNGLIKNRKVELFDNLKLSANQEFYIPRQIFDLGKISGEYFAFAKMEKILLINVAYDLPPNFQGISFLRLNDILEFDVTKPELRSVPILLIASDCTNTDLEKVLKKNSTNKYKTHCFRFLSENLFQWVYSESNYFKFENLYLEYSKKASMMNETELIKSIEQNQRTVFIADLPGMGKSFILASLASGLAQQFPNRLVIFVDFKEFVVKVGSATVEEIVSAIVNLCCSNELEENLVADWLQNGSLPKVELLLDALDEINKDTRLKAINILKLVQDLIPSVRTWVTVRDHMLDEIRLNFKTLGYKLEPYSELEQVSCLVTHWTNFCNKKGKVPPSKDSLTQFAKQCIKVPRTNDENEMASIPLQCSMIAAINEEKVLAGKLTVDLETNYSLGNLYSQMLKRKMQVYLERQNISENCHFTSFVCNGIDSLLVYYATELIFSTTVAEEFAGLLFQRPTETGQLAIMDHGVVKSTSPVQFIHRTFAEYIIADYVYKTWQNETDQAVTRNTKAFQDFVSEHVLTTSKDSSRFRINYPNVCNFIHSKFMRFLPTKQLQLLRKTPFSPIWHPEMYVRRFKRNKRDKQGILTFSTCPFGESKQECLLVMSSDIRRQLLFHALQTFDAELSKYLIREFDEFSPLQWAELQKHSTYQNSVLHWMLKNQIMFASIGVKGQDFIRYVVDKNPSVLEHKDRLGRTAFLFYVMRFCPRHLSDDFLEGCQFFVEKLHANVDATDNYNNNVLHLACSWMARISNKHYTNDLYRANLVENYRQILEYLMEHCKTVTINGINNWGETPLIRIINKISIHSVAFVSIFKKHRADFEIRGKDGNTALYFAILKNATGKLVRKLINCGAKISTKNYNGQTALHLAVKQRNFPVVKLLIEEYGANMHAHDANENTIFQYETSAEIKLYLFLRMR